MAFNTLPCDVRHPCPVRCCACMLPLTNVPPLPPSIPPWYPLPPGSRSAMMRCGCIIGVLGVLLVMRCPPPTLIDHPPPRVSPLCAPLAGAPGAIHPLPCGPRALPNWPCGRGSSVLGFVQRCLAQWLLRSTCARAFSPRCLPACALWPLSPAQLPFLPAACPPSAPPCLALAWLHPPLPLWCGLRSLCEPPLVVLHILLLVVLHILSCSTS